MSVTAGGNVTVSDNLTANNSSVTVDAGGDVAIKNHIDVKNESKLDFDADGGMTVPTIDSADSTVDVQAGTGDIVFDVIEAVDTDLALRTEAGNIFGTDDGSYIRMDDEAVAQPGEASSLTLSAGGDIGKDGERLMVDVPETLTVSIELVDDYYFDGVALVGDAFAGVRPTVDNFEGRAENGDILEGDYLKADGTEHVSVDLDHQTPDELAQWIAESMARDEWLQLLTKEAITKALEQELLEEEMVKIILEDSTALTSAQRNQLLKNAKVTGNYAELAEQIAKALDMTAEEADQMGKTLVDDQTATRILAGAIGVDEVENLEQVLEDMMSQEEILDYIDRFWNASDYEGRSEQMPEDPPARELNVQIGESFGNGNVWNEGAISITQLQGDLTAEDIHSERGDVNLTADNGSIIGADSDVPNVYGSEITLNAAQSIGSADQPLTTEQQANRPTLVGNMLTPATDGSEKLDLVLVERPVLDENGEQLLDENGNPVTEKIWTAVSEIRFDWVRTDYPEEATRLDATAGTDVYIEETSGDAGVGVVTAGGSVSITAPGSIYDVRTETETDENVTAGGDAALNAGSGTIGTNDNYLTTDVDGKINAQAKGDINIDDSADLDLVADSKDGQVNAKAVGDIDLSNTQDQDLVIGPIHSENGDVTITSTNSIVNGKPIVENEAITVVGGSISLNAKDGDAESDGSVGGEESPILVDTNAANGGTLSVSADGDVYITEIDGDVVIDKITSGGDTVLDVDGSVTDVDDSQLVADAVDKNREAEEARSEANSAQTAADIYEKYAGDTGKLTEELGKEAAEKAVEELKKNLAQQQEKLDTLEEQMEALIGSGTAAQKQIDDLQGQIDQQTQSTDLTKEKLNAAEDKLDEINETIELAQKDAEALQAKADELAAIADQKEKEAQDAFDKAAESIDSITVGGDLTITAGGSIGESDNALGMDVEGESALEIGDSAQDDVIIESTGDITIKPIVADDVVIDALGDISSAGSGEDETQSDRDIVAENLQINSVGGSVGKEEDPINTSVDSLTASGEKIYIDNDKDLEIDSVVGGDVNIEVDGDVISDPSDDGADIIADDLTIDASGDVGCEDDPLDIDADNVTINGGDITIDSRDDLNIERIEGDDVKIESDGNVTGGPIYADNLEIDAAGDVGSKDDPLDITVPGYVEIDSLYGYTYVINHYVAPTDGEYIEREFTDEATGVHVHGYHVHVTTEMIVTDLSALNNEAKASLNATTQFALDSAATLEALNITMTSKKHPAFLGALTVSIPMGEAYEGMQLLILGIHEDGASLYTGVVKDGVLTFEVEALGDFIVLNPAMMGEISKLVEHYVYRQNFERLLVTRKASEVIDTAYEQYLTANGAERLAMIENLITMAECAYPFETGYTVPVWLYEGIGDEFKTFNGMMLEVNGKETGLEAGFEGTLSLVDIVSYRRCVRGVADVNASEKLWNVEMPESVK